MKKLILDRLQQKLNSLKEGQISFRVKNGRENLKTKTSQQKCIR